MRELSIDRLRELVTYEPETGELESEKLLSSIDALLAIDARGALVPHGIGGHARTLLTESAERIRALLARLDAAERERDALKRKHTKPRGVMLDYPPDYPGGFDGPTGAE